MITNAFQSILVAFIQLPRAAVEGHEDGIFLLVDEDIDAFAVPVFDDKVTLSVANVHRMQHGHGEYVVAEDVLEVGVGHLIDAFRYLEVFEECGRMHGSITDDELLVFDSVVNDFALFDDEEREVADDTLGADCFYFAFSFQ